MSGMITVISKEGTSLTISEEAARTSKYFESVLNNESDCREIQTNIPHKFLSIAKEFLEYHVTKPMSPIPKPLKDYQNFRNNIEDDFDSNLVTGLNRDDIFDLLYTAQILQSESLISLCAAYTASLINGKNVSELRDFFQVEDDLTEEEKLQIDKENACFRI